MNLSLLHLVEIIPPLILVEAFFSGSEIALLSADRMALKKKALAGDHGAQRALKLLQRPEKVLSITLLMTCFCVIAISGLISLYFIAKFQEHGEWIAILCTSPLIVILGELIPKTLFQRHSTRLAPWVSLPIEWAYRVLYPFTRLLSFYTTRLSRLVGPIEELLAGQRRNSREELRALLSYNKRESEIKASERHIIKRIFEFKDSEARHALIPLVKVEAIAESTTVEEALAKFDKNRHSRMPVYSERVDNITGVLELSDLLSTVNLKQPIQGYVSQAHYVPQTQSLTDLLRMMRQEDVELVIVVDEYGGATGILTFEDIIEEIVGEIHDEYDAVPTDYRQLSEHSWLVQAKMEIQTLNDVLKLELPTGDYETLSGFLLQQFGRIPEPQDELFFNTPAGSFKLTVRTANERTIDTVHIQKME